MSTAIAVIRSQPVWEDTDLAILAWVGVRNGNNLVPAIITDVTSITYQVFDGAAPVGALGTYNPALVIKNVLQTGDLWPFDDPPGFNFDAPLSRTYLPDGPKEYNVELTFTLSGGTVFHARVTIPTLPLTGS